MRGELDKQTGLGADHPPVGDISEEDVLPWLDSDKQKLTFVLCHVSGSI